MAIKAGVQIDALLPGEMAAKAASLGVKKAHMNVASMFVLAVLAGSFIAFGAVFSTTLVAGAGEFLSYGVTRLLAGLGFSMGLILVVIGGAELFTGNNLIAMAWASRLISRREVMRNWCLAYVGNVAGCLGTVLLVVWADVGGLGNGAVGETVVRIARAKVELGPLEALARGILCNALVCLAVWLAIGARSVTDKILAIVFPVTAFVALGFEHSIANWFFLPFGYVLDGQGGVTAAAAARNLVLVTIGNLLGGTLLVASVYWVAYLRNERAIR